MKDITLPYIYIDNEYELNIAILLFIIGKLALDNKGNHRLDFDKIQCFMYLVKNPSKINKVLEIAGKSYVNINEEQIYTIESLSVNFDILYDRSLVKELIKGLAALGVIDSSINYESVEITFSLNDRGKYMVSQLDSKYLKIIEGLIESIGSLASIKSNRLFSLINLAICGA